MKYAVVKHFDLEQFEVGLTRMRDSVDEFLDQWATQRADLDLDAMGAIGRILRLSSLVSGGLRDYFAEHDMETWEFDVLATLRRRGRPITPKDLASSVMISSAALTNRVDRLVARRLVTRKAVPGDRRSVHVALTDSGRDLVDDVVVGHVANQRKMLASIDHTDCDELNRIMRTLLVSLGDTR